MFIGRVVRVRGLTTRWIFHEDRGAHVILKGPVKKDDKIGGVFKCVERERVIEMEDSKSDANS